MAGENMATDAKTTARIKALQARAESAREMRRAAPAVTATGLVAIPQKSIINRVSKDTGGQDGEWHWSFHDRNKLEQDIDQGFEPGIDPATGKWENFGGDTLTKIPTADWDRMLRENKARSDAMLGERMKADAKATGEKVTAQTVNTG